MKLSVVLATYNEEKNLPACLESIKAIADEIIIVDGSSTDKTVEIAKKYGAKVVVVQNYPIFHINKQKALELAKNEWILQLDADEKVTKELAQEIKSVIEMNSQRLEKYQQVFPKKNLFMRHQNLLEKRDGPIGIKTDREYSAFFIPRLNIFLGRALHYGGVYPDGVIRLVRKGKAHFPRTDVHEQIVVLGKVGWLQNDLIHIDSPTFHKYITRWRRYTSLMASDLQKKRTGYSPFVIIKYIILLPLYSFLNTYFRKGFLDGWQGFIFLFFSALRFPAAYMIYIKNSL